MTRPVETFCLFVACRILSVEEPLRIKRRLTGMAISGEGTSLRDRHVDAGEQRTLRRKGRPDAIMAKVDWLIYLRRIEQT